MHLLRGVKDRVFPVGRLDYNSEGLLLMTNDGEFAHRITAPASHMLKTYVVKVNGQLTVEQEKQFQEGHFAARQENLARPAQADQARSQPVVRSTSRRRPPEPDPHHVQAFWTPGGEAAAREDRILELDLPPGRYRLLTPREIERFRKILKLDAPEKARAAE